MKNKIRIIDDVYGTNGEVVIKAGTELTRSPQGDFEYKEGEDVVLTINDTVLNAIDQGLIQAFRYEYIKDL